MIVRLFTTVVGGSAVLVLTSYLSQFALGHGHPALESRSAYTEPAGALLSPLPARSGIYFAPATNLEQIDIPLIASARRSLDIAMYTFTDTRIAEALVRAGERGVVVRLYRDREQFEAEQRRGDRVMMALRRAPNVHVQVKGDSDLMHDKAFAVDGHTLRHGSGNWSLSAAKYQDNEITVTASPSHTAAFEQDFDVMWSRPGNEVIQ